MIRIVTDYANNAETFWATAKERWGNAPDSIRSLLNGNDEIWVSRDEAAAVERWCETVDGWSDDKAPCHAPRPILFLEEDAIEVNGRDVRGDIPYLDENGSITGWMPLEDGEE